MKKVTCSTPSCAQRRAHHERPEDARGVQEFWVHEQTQAPYFCSIECQIYYKIESQEGPRLLGPFVEGGE